MYGSSEPLLQGSGTAYTNKATLENYAAVTALGAIQSPGAAGFQTVGSTQWANTPQMEEDWGHTIFTP